MVTSINYHTSLLFFFVNVIAHCADDVLVVVVVVVKVVGSNLAVVKCYLFVFFNFLTFLKVNIICIFDFKTSKLKHNFFKDLAELDVVIAYGLNNLFL